MTGEVRVGATTTTTTETSHTTKDGMMNGKNLGGAINYYMTEELETKHEVLRRMPRPTCFMCGSAQHFAKE